MENSPNDLKMYEKLLDTIEDNIWIIDRELNYTFCNKNFKKYGWEPSELIGKNISLLLSSESFNKCKHIVSKYLNEAHQGSNQTVTINGKYKDSDKIYTSEVNVSILMNDGSIVGFCGISRDITKRNEMLIENNNVKQALEITGALCHELSQPFQIISGYIELLILDNKLDEHGKLVVDTIYKQIDRVRDILGNLQRIDSYKTKQYVSGSRILDIEKST